MPFFVKTEIPEIVQREFEINMEAINGEISLIDEYAPCLIVSHVSNRKQGWDLRVIEETTPEEGLAKLDSLGTKESTTHKAQTYYRLVLSEDFLEYVSTNPDFTLVSQEAPKADTLNKTKEVLIVNPHVAPVKGRDFSTNAETGSNKYKPVLVREINKEKPLTYKFSR